MAAAFSAPVPFTSMNKSAPNNKKSWNQQELAPGKSAQHTSLMLIPAQGSQLVAASCASLAREKDSDNDVNGQDESKTSLSKEDDVSFISRIFSRKSADEDWSDFEWPKIPTRSDKRNSGVVLYPIVGFRWVNVGGKEYAVPTTSKASCSLKLVNRDEELVGWFSQACFLGNVDDDWGYTHPTEVAP
eukprot:CAMPEP_0195517708 /NCGR_PEP_ID=MMETSP0794_2-20130614/11393_1 /TAXON_ID=515487 /ORGANISM="Stephanopyxis turris, Strain CCMP 815" /LENGTH=186 /DNA_ID=CAMNT_0040646569 /DNA_START=136 /DNA_END=696 /DNA_ORIENTATION=+